MATDSCRSAYLASLSLLVVMLSACKMGPDYHRPETPKADSWRVPSSTAESIANLPWWDLLKDQELQQLVRIALTENLDVRIAAANIEQYQAQLMMPSTIWSHPWTMAVPRFCTCRKTQHNVIPGWWRCDSVILERSGGLRLLAQAIDVGSQMGT